MRFENPTDRNDILRHKKNLRPPFFAEGVIPGHLRGDASNLRDLGKQLREAGHYQRTQVRFNYKSGEVDLFAKKAKQPYSRLGALNDRDAILNKHPAPSQASGAGQGAAAANSSSSRTPAAQKTHARATRGGNQIFSRSFADTLSKNVLDQFYPDSQSPDEVPTINLDGQEEMTPNFR